MLCLLTKPAGSQAAAATPLAATVGYMFVLAGRGGVLGPGMGDTTVRTLVSGGCCPNQGLGLA